MGTVDEEKHLVEVAESPKDDPSLLSPSLRPMTASSSASRPQTTTSVPQGLALNPSMTHTGTPSSKTQAGRKQESGGKMEKKTGKTGKKDKRNGQKGKKATLLVGPEPLASLLRVSGPPAPFVPGVHPVPLERQWASEGQRTAEALIQRNPAGEMCMASSPAVARCAATPTLFVRRLDCGS